MDYKEEYNKALERAKKGLPIDEVFPELKESEDERIRKFLVELVSNDKANNYNRLYEDRGVRFDDVLAWLEKQKEQNSEEIKEESDEEKTRQMIVNTLRDAFISERISITSYTEMLAYLEKQKEKWWNKGYFEGRKNAHIYSPFTILFD